MSAIWFQKIDIGRLAGDSVAIDAELSIGELPRVAAAVLPGSGPFCFFLEFQDTKNGIVLADGTLRGQLTLRCQRCLDEMPVAIDSRLRLALLVDENESEQVPVDYEPLVIPGGEVRVADLIEDEILLMLPIAAKHADDECGPLSESLRSLTTSANQEMTTPFAGLAKIMRDGTD